MSGWAAIRDSVGAAITLGQKAKAQALTFVLASDHDSIGVVGNSDSVTPTLAVTISSAYAAGNVLGSGTGTAGQSGVLTLTGALRVSGGKAIIQSILLLDHANQKPPVDILFFDAVPAATYTDKTTPATMTAADMAHLIRRVSIAASDYVTVNGIAIADVVPPSKLVKGAASANLYAIIFSGGTPTFTVATDLILRSGWLRD